MLPEHRCWAQREHQYRHPDCCCCYCCCYCCCCYCCSRCSSCSGCCGYANRYCYGYGNCYGNCYQRSYGRLSGSCYRHRNCREWGSGGIVGRMNNGLNDLNCEDLPHPMPTAPGDEDELDADGDMTACE